MTGWRPVFFLLIFLVGMGKLDQVESLRDRAIVCSAVAVIFGTFLLYFWYMEEVRFLGSSPSQKLVAPGSKFYQLRLEPDEGVIRADLIHLNAHRAGEIQRANYELAWMILTNRRIAFVPPQLPMWYEVAYLSGLMQPRAVAWPLREAVSIPLSSVDNLIAWSPRFSADPVARLGDYDYQFGAVTKRPPWQKGASRRVLEAHFQAVEQTWLAARKENGEKAQGIVTTPSPEADS